MPGVDRTEDYHPAQVSIFCDRCEYTVSGDYLVHRKDDQEARFGYARSHLRSQGWSCDNQGDFCPDCMKDMRTLSVDLRDKLIDRARADLESWRAAGWKLPDMRKLFTVLRGMDREQRRTDASGGRECAWYYRRDDVEDALGWPRGTLDTPASQSKDLYN